MTAEQALIEENKKDPRVRYITEDAKLINLWSIKPFFDSEFNVWVGKKVTLINSLKYQNFSDFKDKDSIDCILCIDDIKPEVPPIPEKWYIEYTEENKEILDVWRLENAEDCLDYDVCVGYLLLSENVSDESLFYANYIQYFEGDSNYKDYQKITLDQFKKYVLVIEEKQEEIQEPNDFKLSSTPCVAGRISSNDVIETTNNNTTFEFYSTKCWLEDRINYINQFIKRNIDSDLCINPDWISERNELIEKLKNL